MEKIIVKPNEVRALGDIVSPKTSSDFLPYQSSIASGTDTDYGTVYTSGVLASSNLTVNGSRWITPSGDNFTVSVVLKNSSNTAISSATVQCIVNEDNVLTATTGNDGTATFTIPKVTDVCVYDLLFTYAGTSSIAGCFRGFKIYTGSDEWDLDLIGEKSIIQTDETDVLIARITAEDCNGEVVGVPGETVYFFEEWTPNVRLSGEANIIQSGDTDVLTAQLIDNEDGSIIKESGHTVYFMYPSSEVKINLTLYGGGETMFALDVKLRDKNDDYHAFANTSFSVYVDGNLFNTFTTNANGNYAGTVGSSAGTHSVGIKVTYNSNDYVVSDSVEV